MERLQPGERAAVVWPAHDTPFVVFNDNFAVLYTRPPLVGLPYKELQYDSANHSSLNFIQFYDGGSRTLLEEECHHLSEWAENYFKNSGGGGEGGDCGCDLSGITDDISSLNRRVSVTESSLSDAIANVSRIDNDSTALKNTVNGMVSAIATNSGRLDNHEVRITDLEAGGGGGSSGPSSAHFSCRAHTDIGITNDWSPYAGTIIPLTSSTNYDVIRSDDVSLEGTGTLVVPKGMVGSGKIPLMLVSNVSWDRQSSSVDSITFTQRVYVKFLGTATGTVSVDIGQHTVTHTRANGSRKSTQYDLLVTIPECQQYSSTEYSKFEIHVRTSNSDSYATSNLTSGYVYSPEWVFHLELDFTRKTTWMSRTRDTLSSAIEACKFWK